MGREGGEEEEGERERGKGELGAGKAFIKAFIKAPIKPKMTICLGCVDQCQFKQQIIQSPN